MSKISTPSLIAAIMEAFDSSNAASISSVYLNLYLGESSSLQGYMISASRPYFETCLRRTNEDLASDIVVGP